MAGFLTPPRHNDFTMPKNIPPDGILIIVGKEGILIGESIQVLKRRSTPEVTHAGVYTDSAGAPFAYLQLYYPAYSTRHGTHPPRYAMLRLPEHLPRYGYDRLGGHFDRSRRH